MDGSPTEALQVQRGPFRIGWVARWVTVRPSTAVTWSEQSWAWTRLAAGRKAFVAMLREDLRRDFEHFLETEPQWCPVCGGVHPWGPAGSPLLCTRDLTDTPLRGLLNTDGIDQEPPS